MSLIKKYIKTNNIDGLKSEKKIHMITAAVKTIIGLWGLDSMATLLKDGEFKKPFDGHMMSENAAIALSVVTTAIGTTAGLNLVKAIVAGHYAKKIENRTERVR